MAEGERVECQICGANLKTVQWTHLRKHDLTIDEYKEMFPNAELVSKEKRVNHSELMKGSDNPNWKGGGYKECEICGEKFWAKPSEADRRFCSAKCTGKWVSENKSGENAPMYGRRGEDSPLYGRSRPEFSKMIQGSNHPNWKGGGTELECDNCGRKILRKPSKVHEHNFCSYECMGEWRLGRFCGENSPSWRGGFEPFYGENWHSQREKAIERDDHICQICGAEENSREHDVHHVTPIREFNCNYEEANKLSNLITLCMSCHRDAEAGRIPKSSLRAIVAEA